jgi:hypothetical protein
MQTTRVVKVVSVGQGGAGQGRRPAGARGKTSCGRPRLAARLALSRPRIIRRPEFEPGKRVTQPVHVETHGVRQFQIAGSGTRAPAWCRPGKVLAYKADMQTMADFFAGGRSIEFVLVLIALEAIVLMVLWWMRRCPLPPMATLLILAPGTSLLLAARAALAGASFVWVSSLFLLALLIHLVDLRQRWQERRRQAPASIAPGD